MQPNHSSREWLLAENHHDGKILAYAVVSWNDTDPADYLAAGWWLVYPPGVPYWMEDEATRGVFIDGPELDPTAPPELPTAGTATYVGAAGGLYAYRYGRAWGELADTTDLTEFTGPMALIADFDQSLLTGLPGVPRADRDRPRPPPLSDPHVAGPRSHRVAGRLQAGLYRVL